MKHKSSSYNHTGKSARVPEKTITLDANMIGYLNALNDPNLTQLEYTRIKRILNAKEMEEVNKLLNHGYEDVKFCTTPQVISEVLAYANIKHDYAIMDFLAELCKVPIPRTTTGKVKYAELIVDLMEEYTKLDIALSDDTRALQSAVASEPKQGVENSDDALIVAQNVVLNGGPLVTKNEKHLIEMKDVKLRNNLRSEAILDKNKAFLKSHKTVIPNKTVRMHLKDKKSTTFRITDIPHILER